MSFVQVSLWSDCTNDCSFCQLPRDVRFKTTSLEHKRKRLINAANFAKECSADRIGFIGGEFFQGQLKGCESEWMRLMEALAKSDSNALFTANLIGKPYYLLETLDVLNNEVTICTSFDQEGRFHSDGARTSWFNNIERLHGRGVHVVCTVIITQDFLEWDYSLPDWLEVNFNEPILSTHWYKSVDKVHYHESLIRDNQSFSLPKRRTTIEWMKKHPHIAKNYVDFGGSHPDDVYAFDADDELRELWFDYTTSVKYNDPICGHPYPARCYADSDRCMMCDAKLVVESLGDLG